MLVTVVQPSSAAGDAGELPYQGELQSMLHHARGTAGTGGGTDGDSGEGRDPLGLTSVLKITLRGRVRTVLVVAAACGGPSLVSDFQGTVRGNLHSSEI